jgi:hypothetical protein
VIFEKIVTDDPYDFGEREERKVKMKKYVF